MACWIWSTYSKGKDDAGIQFQFFDKIELTNGIFAIIQSTFYRLIKGQQYFIVIQIAKQNQAF